MKHGSFVSAVRPTPTPSPLYKYNHSVGLQRYAQQLCVGQLHAVVENQTCQREESEACNDTHTHTQTSCATDPHGKALRCERYPKPASYPYHTRRSPARNVKQRAASDAHPAAATSDSGSGSSHRTDTCRVGSTCIAVRRRRAQGHGSEGTGAERQVKPLQLPAWGRQVEERSRHSNRETGLFLSDGRLGAPSSPLHCTARWPQRMRQRRSGPGSMYPHRAKVSSSN